MAVLLYERDALSRQAWLTAAATSIKVYSSNQLIFEAETIYKESWHKLGLKARGERIMATAAIQEQQDLAQVSVENGIQDNEQATPTKTATIVRSMALSDIATDLEAEPGALQSFLEEHNATLIDFGGTILVPETEAVAAYEHYSLVRARQKMQQRFATSSAPTTEEKPSTKQKNSAPKESKPKKPTLTWKGNFKALKSSYKKTLQNALNALFPNSPDEQTIALTDIVNQTDLGKAIVDKISRDPIYTDKARAREQISKTAAELAAESGNQSSVEEEKAEATV